MKMLRNGSQGRPRWNSAVGLGEVGCGSSARIEEEATQILAGQLEDEMKKDRPGKKGEDLNDDLLTQALADVNWTELAEDLLRHERLPRP